MSYYLSPAGNDSGSGSLADPWRTLAKARGAPAGSTINIAPGAYPATKLAFANPISLIALGPVSIESAVPRPTWQQVTLGAYSVWHATVSMTRDARQATWTDDSGLSHRVPLWAHTAPLFDTAQHWADSVLNPGNLHTRWGLWSSTTDLYLIPPVDGAWTDPNTAHVQVVHELFGFAVSGPDFSMSGPFTVAGHQYGVRLGGTSARCHLDGVTFRNCGAGVSIVGDLPATYSHDHLVEHCRFEDDLSSLAEGQAFVPHQMISWNIIKGVQLNYGIKDTTGKLITTVRALTSAESVGFRTEGGSINTVVSECEFDRTFDAVSHYQSPGRYDARADGNLLITDCEMRNIVDDVWDRAGHQDHVRIENCTLRNVGVVMSPAPLFGTVTLKNIRASLIGDQVRVPDGTGARPPGSVVKYGAADYRDPHGTVNFEDCIFWTDNPTTQGFCPDGGDGANVPSLHFTRCTLRVGGIVGNWGANYPHPADWLTLDDTTLATSGSRPLKTNLTTIVVTPVAEVDSRYSDPSSGDFEDAHMIATLLAQIATLEAELVTARAALQAEYDALAALALAKKAADVAWAVALDELLAA